METRSDGSRCDQSCREGWRPGVKGTGVTNLVGRGGEEERGKQV